MTDPIRIWCIANYKGGTGKTTTAAMLMHSLAAYKGRTVIGVDCDPQGSLAEWATSWGDTPLPVVGLATGGMHRQIWGVIDRRRYTDVVIDTPPLEQKAGIVQSALSVVGDQDGTVIIPLGPSTIEMDRIGDTRKALDECGVPPESVVVLLNRVKGGTFGKGHPKEGVLRSMAARAIHNQLERDGLGILGTHIPHRDADSIAFGAPVFPGIEWWDVVDELLPELRGRR